MKKNSLILRILLLYVTFALSNNSSLASSGTKGVISSQAGIGVNADTRHYIGRKLKTEYRL